MKGVVRRFACAAAVTALAAAVLAVPVRAQPNGAIASRSPEAQKVYDALDKLKRAETEQPAAVLRDITLTEQELNAYISHRIRTEKAGPLKDFRLKLFPENRVEGLMFLDLTKLGAPAVLPDVLHFYFSGRLAVREERMKLEVQDLFLEFKPVPVFLLNLAFYIASKTQKHGSASLADWHELPLGIKDIVCRKGRITLRY